MLRRKKTIWKDFEKSSKRRYRVVLKYVEQLNKIIKRSFKREKRAFLRRISLEVYFIEKRVKIIQRKYKKYERKLKKKLGETEEKTEEFIVFLKGYLRRIKRESRKKLLMYKRRARKKVLKEGKLICGLLNEIVDDEKELFEETLDGIGEKLLRFLDFIPWYQEELLKELDYFITDSGSYLKKKIRPKIRLLTRRIKALSKKNPYFQKFKHWLKTPLKPLVSPEINYFSGMRMIKAVKDDPRTPLITCFIFLLVTGWIFSSWIVKASPDIETKRPQTHTAVPTQTTNPEYAYDASGSTTQSDTEYDTNAAPAVAFWNWSSVGYTYTSLILKVEYEAQAAGGGDTYEIEYSTDNTSGQCDSGTWTDLVSPTSAAAADHTLASTTLSTSQDLTKLCVRLNIVKSGGPDNAHVYIEDIRTEGEYSPPADATSFTNDTEGGLTDGGRIGQSITVSGSNFGDDPGAGNRSTATDNVKIGTFQILDADVSAWSSTSISFTVSASIDVYGGSGSNGLIVRANGQNDPTPLTFYVYPDITSLTTPSISNAARETEIITIHGNRFGSATGTGSILGFGFIVIDWEDTAVTTTVPTEIADDNNTGDVVLYRNTDSKTDTFSNFRVLPRIQSLNPSSGPVGTEVTISGDHFCQEGTCPGAGDRNTATTTVTFNSTNVPDGDVTTWTATTVVALVPSGASTGPVIVKTNNYDSDSATFTVALPPNATSFTNDTDGGLADGGRPTHQITVSGTDFGDGPCSAGTTEVKIDTYQVACGSISTWSSTTIVFTIPTGSDLPDGGTGSNGLIVRRDSIDDTSPLTFYVYPRITSPTPTTGRQGDSIIVSGDVFGAVQGTSTVAINGTDGTITSFSSTSIDVTIEGGTISGNIVFTRDPDSKTSNNYSFTILPRITSPTPASATVSDAITIFGDHFDTATGTVTVNTAAATISSWADTSIDITVPDGTASGSVAVTRSDSQVSNNWAFVIKAQITSLSTSSAKATDSITINGNHFGADPGAGNRSTASNHVTINGSQVADADVTSWSDTSIAAKVPLGGTISGNVVVTANSEDSNGESFTILPRVTSPTPSSGRSGDAITISGDHFGVSSATATVNSATATVSSWGDTSIDITVPLSGSITGNIVVTRSDSQDSDNWSFTILPKITSLNPDNGIPGDSITISGDHFGTDPGAGNRSTATDNVTFNGTQVAEADVTSWSDTSVAAKVPIGATTGNVLVRRDNNDSNGFTFTVNTPDATSFINNTSGGLSDGGTLEDSITVSGSNFGNGPCEGTNNKLKIGTFNVPCADVSSWTSTSITFSISTSTNVYGGSGSSGLITRAGGMDDSTPLTFYVYPKIDSITVPIGFTASTAREYQVGDTDGVITLNGSRLGTAGTVTVLGQNATTTSYGDTAIELQIPDTIADDSYTGDIILTRTNPSDSKTASSTNFRILPRISSLSPNSGLEGEQVTISGDHFCQDASCPEAGQRNIATTTVTFNGVNVLDADVTAWTATTVVVLVPTGAATGPVVVKSNDYDSDGVTFSLGAAVPDATSFANDTEGSLIDGGRPTQSITVTGTNFDSACSAPSTQVKIGTFSIPCSDVSSWASTSITFTIPTSTTAYGGSDSDGLIVRANDQDDATPLAFFIYPNVTDITAPSIAGAAREGETMTLTGWRFGTAGTITVLGETASVSSWQDTGVSLTVPLSITDDDYTGAITLTRTSPSGNKSHTATSSFRILPKITSLSPSTGDVGTPITISGNHLCQTGTCPSPGERDTATTTVTFNGINVPDLGVDSWTATSVVTAVPTGALTGPVIVKSNGYDSNSLNFTVGEETTPSTPAIGSTRGLPPPVEAEEVSPIEEQKAEIARQIQITSLKIQILSIQKKILQLGEQLQEELKKEAPPPTLPPKEEIPIEVEEAPPPPPPEIEEVPLPPALEEEVLPPLEVKAPPVLQQFGRQIIQTTQKITDQGIEAFREITDFAFNSFKNLIQTTQKQTQKVVSKFNELTDLAFNQLKNISIQVQPPAEKTPSPEEIVEPEIKPLPEPSEPPQVVKTDTILVRSTFGNINLDLTEKEAKVIAGKEVVIFIKPSKPVSQLEGFLFFEKVAQIKPQPSLASIFIPEALAATAFAKTYEIQSLVFEGPDEQGFWKTTLSIPPIAGEYKLGVNISFVDGSEKNLEKIVLVDPEGYIYEELTRGQLRIQRAKATLWVFNESLNNYVIWPADLYDQKNPQITDETGQYSFLVPEGIYYLEVEHSDYELYKSESFQVREGEPVHFNVKLKLRSLWQRFSPF